MPDPRPPLAYLFERLFDDAAVFPPGDAPLPQAVTDHAGHRGAWYAPMVGAFVVPSPSVGELTQLVRSSEAPTLDVAITGRGDAPSFAADLELALVDPALTVRAVEVAVPTGSDGDGAALAAQEVLKLTAAVPDGVMTFVEAVPADSLNGLLDELGNESGRVVRAKLRTGGLASSAFPSDKELAEWIVACVARGIPFKCTAGLHHALRHTAADTQFEHHGFLNVILAVHEALGTGDTDAVAAALACRDADAVRASITRLSAEAAVELRRGFLSFGTCSVTEPLDDLLELGLVAAPG